jgi:hypothetical protein
MKFLESTEIATLDLIRINRIKWINFRVTDVGYVIRIVSDDSTWIESFLRDEEKKARLRYAEIRKIVNSEQ